MQPQRHLSLDERSLLLRRFSRDFLGRSTNQRVYLDAAATSLMPRLVWGVQQRYYERACANPHTNAHIEGRATTACMEAARRSVAALMGAPPQEYATLFVGNGSTGALNRAARLFFSRNSDRTAVLTSVLEHHSNILPWTRMSRSVLYGNHRPDGSIDIEALRRILQTDGPRIRVVAVTAASNVTGAVSPLREIANMAHRAGAWLVVDAAQAAPHMPINMLADGIDVLAISGHKLYAPGSPGVLIARRTLFGDGVVGDVGGGTVETVDLRGAELKHMIEEREEAGTPNVPGTLGLGAMATMLRIIGMDLVQQYDWSLTERLLQGLRSRPFLRVYGSDAPGGQHRIGAVAFNMLGVPHGLVAVILSDVFGIAVRNECFCAQPYVRSLLQEAGGSATTYNGSAPVRPGMVRASLGVFSQSADIDALLRALDDLHVNLPTYAASYRLDPATGVWRSVNPLPTSGYSIDQAVGEYAGSLLQG